MKVNAVNPRFQVFLFGFVPNNPTNLSARLSQSEILAMGSPIEILGEYIDSVTYTDTVESGSFSITLAKGGTGYLFSSTGSRLRIREIFRVGEIIVITESQKIKFAGRITSASHSSSVTGEQDYVVSGGGLESAIQSQTLFIDFDNSGPNVAGQPASAVANAPIPRIQAALNIIAEAVQDSKTPHGILKSLTESAIETLLSNGNYGGKQFSSLVEQTFDPLSYTVGFIHTTQWFTAQSFGNTLSIWSLMASIAKPPLYELFFHYDQECYFSASENLIPIQRKISLKESDDYTPDTPIAYLIFRRTPFSKLDSSFDDPLGGVVSEVLESNFNSFDLSENEGDIFSGVHANVGIMDNLTGLALNPVTYNPSLLAKFGQRVFQVTMDGVGFPTEAQNEGAQAPFKALLSEIQEKIYKTFGTGERIFTGSFSGHYFRGLCKGQILKITDNDGSDKLHKEIKQYDPKFYVTGIRVNWKPGLGIATQETMVKWGKRKVDPSWEFNSTR